MGKNVELTVLWVLFAALLAGNMLILVLSGMQAEAKKTRLVVSTGEMNICKDILVEKDTDKSYGTLDGPIQVKSTGLNSVFADGTHQCPWPRKHSAARMSISIVSFLVTVLAIFGVVKGKGWAVWIFVVGTAFFCVCYFVFTWWDLDAALKAEKRCKAWTPEIFDAFVTCKKTPFIITSMMELLITVVCGLAVWLGLRNRNYARRGGYPDKSKGKSKSGTEDRASLANAASAEPSAPPSGSASSNPFATASHV